MSYRLLNLAWSARGLTGNEKCVLVRLADRADDDGKCFPGHKSIAADCGLSLRSVRNVLPILEAKGHITITREAQRAYQGQSLFTYAIHPLAPANGAAATPANGAAATPANGAAATPANIAPDTGKSRIPHRQTVPPHINTLNPQCNHNGEAAPPVDLENGKPEISPTLRIQHNDEIKAVRVEMEKLRSWKSGGNAWSETQRLRFAELKERDKELLIILGRKA